MRRMVRRDKRKAFASNIPPILQEANLAFDKGEYGRAAQLFERIAEGADARGMDQLTRSGTSLTDREVMELILLGTAEEVRAAMPLMSEEQKRLVLTTQSQENKRP